MQLVRTHQVLGFLSDLAIARRGQKLGRHRRIKNIEQRLGDAAAKDVGRIAHQMAHERLGHTRVDGIHTHVVTVVGGPAERQLTKVARADDKAAGLVGQIHQNLRALARLTVLVGHVLDRRVVLDILKVLLHRRMNRDLAKAHAQVARKRLSVGLGTVRGAKTRHGDSRDTGTWQAQGVKRTNGHEQRQRGIEAARKTDDGRLGSRMRKARLKTGSLQVEDGLAALGQVAVVCRNKGRAREDAVDIAGIAQGGLFGERSLKRKLNGRGLRRIVRARPRRRAAALGHQAVKVNVCHRHVAGEQLGRGEFRAVFVDEVLARKDHIGRGLALTRVRVSIGAVQTRALVGDETAAVVGLADDFIRSRRIENHRRAGKRHLGRRRRRHPQVLADLDAEHQVLGTLVTTTVDKPRAERHRTLSGKFNPHGIGGCRGKPAAFVELTIVGQILLGRKAQQLTRTAHGGAVVDVLGHRNGQANRKDDRQLTGFIENTHEPCLANMQ